MASIKAGAEYVLGVDIMDRYLERANFIRDALGYENLEFRDVDVCDLTPELVGTFDVVLCFGILYHLQDLIRGMKEIANLATRTMLLDTQWAAARVHEPPPSQPVTVEDGPGPCQQSQGRNDELVARMSDLQVLPN